MKKRNIPAKKMILGSTVLLLLAGMNTPSQAQWAMSAVNTFTNANVGIGTMAPVTDARLRVNTISDEDALLSYASTANTIPGILVQREFYKSPNLFSNPKNIMEVWSRTHTPAGGGSFSTSANKIGFVIDNLSKVGIGKFPSKQLDVEQDANIDGVLDVGNSAGASSATDALVVHGNITFTRPLDAQYRNFRARTNAGSLVMLANTSGEDGPAISMNGVGNSTSGAPGAIAFSAVGSGTNPAFNFNTYNPAGSGSWNQAVSILADGRTAIGSLNPLYPASGYKLYVSEGIYTDGKVTIGPSTLPVPAGYRLYVDDGIITKRLKIALPSDPANWSDFVFADDYELRPLKDVEQFIRQHKHLPEIPSTAEVHKDGLDVAQINAKLLQKVEELTLYVIQQQKDIEALKKRK